MSFPVLTSQLKNSNLVVFFDLEGTQFTHRAIALGLVAYEKEKGSLFFDEEKKIIYHSYIRTEDEIGPVVEQLTGITPDLLEEKGKDFHTVVLEITKLLRPYQKKYVSYGSLDIKMLHETLENGDETEENFFRNVTKNYLDFHAYLSKRIVDGKGQAYSISRLLNLFEFSPSGNSHDPLSDSIDLSHIFFSYLHHEEKDLELYLKNYLSNPFTGSINHTLVAELLKKGSLEKEDLYRLLRENL